LKDIHTNEITKIKVLNYLNKHNGEWVKADRLASVVNLSVSSTRKIILELKQEIADVEEQIELTVSKNKGVLMQTLKKIDFQEVISRIYSSTMTYNIIYTFLNQSMSNATQYCMDNYISESSLRRKIVALNQALSDRGIYFKKNRIVGDEFAIRNFLYQYYWEIHKDSTWPFNSVDKNKILANISLLEKRFGFCLADIQKEQFCFFLGISQIRRTKNCPIEAPIQECLLFSKGNLLYSDFKDELLCIPMYTKISEYELQYLFYGFFCSHINFNSISSSKTRMIYDILKKQNAESNFLIEELLEELDRQLYPYKSKIDYSILGMELTAICHTAFFTSNMLIPPRKYDYTESLKMSYPHLFKNIDSACRKILHKFNDKFDYNIIFEYVSLILHTSNIASKYGKRIKIMVMSSEGTLNEDVIRKSISQYFSSSYTIDFVYEGQNYDILLTDIGGVYAKSKNSFYLKHHRLEIRDLLSLDHLFDVSFRGEQAIS
jgi:Mga helix-turn-helix domain.